MKHNLHLLVIDPQNDFCDLPTEYTPVDPSTGTQYAPALPVSGAHADMLRLAELINRGHDGLSQISVTLDSHHRLDIAHPTFWRQADGQPVVTFTEISAEEVRAGKYLPRDPNALQRTVCYLDALESSGRYRLMVWPVHCEMGTWGHNVHAAVRAAYNQWEDKALGIVTKVTKGSNPWTEHYSAVMAEVPDPDDPQTQLNRGFLDVLTAADRVYITGEAGSHCVKATTEHIVEHFCPEDRSKLVLVTDCMSAVTGFETHHHQFLADMQALGLQIAKAADVVPELIANARR